MKKSATASREGVAPHKLKKKSKLPNTVLGRYPMVMEDGGPVRSFRKTTKPYTDYKTDVRLEGPLKTPSILNNELLPNEGIYDLPRHAQGKYLNALRDSNRTTGEILAEKFNFPLRGDTAPQYVKGEIYNNLDTSKLTKEQLKVISDSRKVTYSPSYYIDKYKDGGPIKPIKVTDPNDPRLKAYNDSLTLSKIWVGMPAEEMYSPLSKSLMSDEQKQNWFREIRPTLELEDKKNSVERLTGGMDTSLIFTTNIAPHTSRRTNYYTEYFFKPPVQPVELVKRPNKYTTKAPMLEPSTNISMDILDDGRGKNVSIGPDRIMMPSGEEVSRSKFIKQYGEAAWKRATNQRMQHGGEVNPPSKYVLPSIIKQNFDKSQALAEEYTTKRTGKNLTQRQKDAGINPHTGKPFATGMVEYAPIDPITDIIIPSGVISKALNNIRYTNLLKEGRKGYDQIARQYFDTGDNFMETRGFHPEFIKRWGDINKFYDIVKEKQIVFNSYGNSPHVRKAPKNAYLDLKNRVSKVGFKDVKVGVTDDYNVISNNQGISYSTPLKSKKDKQVFINRNPLKINSPRSTTIHELSHYMDNNGQLLSSSDVGLLHKGFYPDLRTYKTEFPNVDSKRISYYLDPTEIRARLNEIRHIVSPNDPWRKIDNTDDIFNNQVVRKDGHLSNMLNLVENKDKFLDTYNKMWGTTGALLGGGYLTSKNNQKFEQGGQVQNNMIPINIEKNELLTDQNGNIIRGYPGQDPHNENGKDPAKNFVFAPEGSMVIPANLTNAFTRGDKLRKDSIIAFLQRRQKDEGRMKMGGIVAEVQQVDATGQAPKLKKQPSFNSISSDVSTAAGIATVGLGAAGLDIKGPSYSQSIAGAINPAIGAVSTLATNILDNTGKVGEGIGTTIFDPARNLNTVFDSKASTEDKIGELLLPGYTSYFGSSKDDDVKQAQKEREALQDQITKNQLQVNASQMLNNQPMKEEIINSERFKYGGVVNKYNDGGITDFYNSTRTTSKPWLDKFATPTLSTSDLMGNVGDIASYTKPLNYDPITIASTRPRGGLNLNNPAFDKGAAYTEDPYANYLPNPDREVKRQPRTGMRDWVNKNSDALTAIGGAALNSIGPIYDLILSRKGYDRANYGRLNPSFIKDDAAMAEVDSSVAMGKDAIRRSNPSGGGMRNALLALVAKRAGLKSGIAERTYNQNVAIGNQAKQANLQIGMQEQIDTAQNKARWEDIRRKAVGDIGKNITYGIKDYQTGDMNDLYMQMLINRYGDYESFNDLINSDPTLSRIVKRTSK